MEHKGTKYIETERLILRPFCIDDAEAMFRNWTSDPEVTKYLTWPPHQSVETTKALCAMWSEKTKNLEVYQWAVVLKEINEPIGSLSVVSCNDAVRSADLGYCIGRAWWGKGLMAEAVRPVIEYLIRVVGMNRVAACHDAGNPNSGRVMQKVGMKKEGVLRAALRNNQGIVDEVWYSILAEEL